MPSGFGWMPEAPTVLGARTLHRVDISKCKGHSSTDHPRLIKIHSIIRPILRG